MKSPDLEQITEIGNRGLWKTKRAHDLLRDQGAIQLPALNQYNEQPILIDKIAERVLIENLAQTELTWHIRSEEHGTLYTRFGRVYTRPTVKGVPRGFAVLDGIDGSRAASAFLTGSHDPLDTRYATMEGLTQILDPEVTDPQISEFVYSGNLEHVYSTKPEEAYNRWKRNPNAVGRLVYATKGMGAHELLTDGSHRDLHAAQDGNLGPNTAGYMLEFPYFGLPHDGDKIQAHLDAHGISVFKVYSSASHAIDLASGAVMPDYAVVQPVTVIGKDFLRYRDIKEPTEGYRRVLFLGETMRKGNEEWIIDNTLFTEAGLVVRTLVEGQPVDLGELRAIESAKGWSNTRRTKQRPVFVAGSREAADQLLLAS